jgi:hypothetical protein
MSIATAQKTPITSEEFIDTLINDHFWDQAVDEFLRGLRSRQLFFDWAWERAFDSSFEITDEENFEDCLMHAYDCTEKGLS